MIQLHNIQDPFVTYAQNFEDVILWRALKHLEKGFYIDVGAAWPENDSVTKGFYDRGWHGINIEPNPVFFQGLKSARERDINLDVAVLDRATTVELSLIVDTGLSTTCTEVASSHIQNGFRSEVLSVKTLALSQIWDQFVPKGQDVHFLKIDVEGAEKAVLQGWNHSVHKPWIIVIEATVPMSSEENFLEWESLVLAAKYELVYSDGLNRFYLSYERRDLTPAFKYPPNPFDLYVVGKQKAIEADLVKQQGKVKELESANSTFQISLIQNQANLQNLESKLEEQQEVVKRLDSENQTIGGKLAERETQAQMLEANCEVLKIEVTELESKIQETANREAIQSLLLRDLGAEKDGLNEKVSKLQALKLSLVELNQLAESQKTYLQSCLDKADKRNADLELEKQNLLNSTSWRILTPLRWIVFQLRLAQKHGIGERISALIKRILRRFFLFLWRRPKLKRRLSQIAQLIGVSQFAIKIYRDIFNQTPTPNSIDLITYPTQLPISNTHMSPRARATLDRLTSVIERNNQK
jgi:FkbM family methyltransferase